MEENVLIDGTYQNSRLTHLILHISFGSMFQQDLHSFLLVTFTSKYESRVPILYLVRVFARKFYRSQRGVLTSRLEVKVNLQSP